MIYFFIFIASLIIGIYIYVRQSAKWEKSEKIYEEWISKMYGIEDLDELERLWIIVWRRLDARDLVVGGSQVHLDFLYFSARNPKIQRDYTRLIIG